MRYEDRFRRFDPAVLTATKTLMQGWGQATIEEKWTRSREWLRDASEIYGIGRPTLRHDYVGTGMYVPTLHAVFMEYPSIMTLLHEFRHARQHLDPRVRVQWGSDQVEDDARAWSMSLYKTVAPRTFERLAREGAILYATV